MTGALIITTTIPTVVATAVVGDVTKTVFRSAGKGKAKAKKKVVLRGHWHFKAGKPYAHSHEGGHKRHQHKSLRDYGRTKTSLKN